MLATHEDLESGRIFVNPGSSYHASGALAAWTAGNGVSWQMEEDALGRTASITVSGSGTGQPELWSSGLYAFDGAGNIVGIGEQRYAYDGAQRLIEAWVLPQSSDRALGMQSSQRRKVSYGYDIFGNMLTRERTDELFAVPAGYEFDMGSSPMMRNRVASSMGDYDAGGRMTRVPGNAGAMMSLLWDAEDRLRVTYGSPVESGGSPSAWNLYDASGYRVVRAEEGARSGIPKLSIRDGAGAVLSEYRVDSASGALVWERDLIRAFGQVIAEREPSDTVPMLSVTHAAASGGTFGFSIGNHVTGSTYAADITTRSGYHHAVFGIEPDAQGHFTLAETHFADGETSFVRIRGEGDALSAYSLAASVSRDESVTESSDNTIRALSLGRSGTDIALRWEVAASNGKGTKIYFRQPGGTVVTVTPMALPPATKTLALSSQSLSIGCGSFFMTQKHPQTGLESSATGDLELVLDAGSQGCDPPPGPEDPPQEGEIYVDRFHHRDHLGSLRVVTDSAGNRIEGMDYYPFGMELVPDGESPGATSRMKYTGHERDESAGMDYMLARYHSSSLVRFESVDPLPESARASATQSWNRFSYVEDNPVAFTDPRGEAKLQFFIDSGRLVVNPEVRGRDPYEIRATSGRGSSMNNPRDTRKRNEGPIPPGSYTAESSKLIDRSLLGDLLFNLRNGDWGDFHVPLTPDASTDTKDESGEPREGFHLHGGSDPGSAGCIDVGGGLFGTDLTQALKRDIQEDPDGIVEVKVSPTDSEDAAPGAQRVLDPETDL